MTWLLSLFAVSFGLAVVPVLSTELYLVTVLAGNPDLPWWLAGPVAALGQVLGKSVHYLAARGSLRLPRLVRGRSHPGPRAARLLARLQGYLLRHPRRVGPLVASSAALGLPPFTLLVIGAGLAGTPPRLLIPISVSGRILRFSALAALPGMLDAWWW